MSENTIPQIKPIKVTAYETTQCKYEMVVADASLKICSWFSPMAMTMRSSAKDLGMALSARICLAQGARRKASFVMLNGHPCGMLQGWRWGRPKPPARVF